MTNDSGLFPALDARPITSYCGPTALAALTGCSVVDAENATLAHRATHGKPRRERMRHGVRVKTTWSNEIEPVAKRLGFVATELPLEAFALWRVSLARFARHTMRRYPNARLLVLVTGHFIALRNGEFVDTWSRTPTPLSKYHHRRCRVQRAWIITQGEQS